MNVCVCVIHKYNHSYIYFALGCICLYSNNYIEQCTNKHDSKLKL